MHSRIRTRVARASVGFALVAGLATLAPLAEAARVAVISNRFAIETATDFSAKITGHSFTPIIPSSAPTLKDLTDNYDVILLFEDTTFAGAPAVGDLVAAFAKYGKTVVFGTFYDEDRSDAPSSPFTSHGWGQMETIDPNTTDGVGTPGAYRSLNVASMLPSPLTTGIHSLASAKWAGGNEAKPGTIVVATWDQKNARGNPDPAIAYRVTGAACVVHVAIAPDYPTVGIEGVDFTGDFYAVWKNAFDFASHQCVAAAPGVFIVPTLDSVALAALALLLAALGAVTLRRQRAR